MQLRLVIDAWYRCVMLKMSMIYKRGIGRRVSSAADSLYIESFIFKSFYRLAIRRTLSPQRTM